LKEVDFSI